MFCVLSASGTSTMWFSGWSSVGRILLFAITAYGLFLLLIRGFGQRTLSKMNPSDFVITVAIGSTVAAFILSKDVSFVDGVVALTTLIALQAGTEWATTRWRGVTRTAFET